MELNEVRCDLLSEFLTLHQQQQLPTAYLMHGYSCDLLSEFLTLHQQQQHVRVTYACNVCCDLLSEFLTLHQQQQLFVYDIREMAVVICFQNF